ncbi:MAG: hypothetical protein ACE5E9_12740 [Nitrospinaceae bacterium]
MGSRAIRVGVGFAVAVFLMSAMAHGAEAAKRLPKAFLKEAAKLAAREADYFQKRQQSDWQALYNYQHPRFRKNVSFEEFKYFEGRVAFNYRNSGTNHLSGGLTPSLAYIKTNPEKRDALGNPQPRHFKWFKNPFIRVRDFAIKKISISKDRKYAMVAVELRGREKLNPALVRGNMEFDFKKPHVDYWEKVNGRWKIALLANPASISGGSRVMYYIPNDNSAWEKMQFIEVPPNLREK